MQKEKGRVIKRQKNRQQLLQLSSQQLNSKADGALWHQTPEMGAEALIASIDSSREIKKALRKMIMKRKKIIRREEIIR
jgi:hypothetical protein